MKQKTIPTESSSEVYLTSTKATKEDLRSILEEPVLFVASEAGAKQGLLSIFQLQ